MPYNYSPTGPWGSQGTITYYQYPLVLPTAAAPPPATVAASTGVNPVETSYALYGHTVPLSVFGVGRIGGEIISGPWIENGLASFIISFGVPADPSGTRDLREIAFDSEVVWDSVNGFHTEAFTYRFYGGTLTQLADPLETTHFGSDAIAYRPQILLAFSNLPLANTKFGKIPYVAAVIGDASGDDVNLGEAFERLAYSPWVGYTSSQFETSGITDGLVDGGLIIAQDAEFLSTIQQFGRFYPNWDILQTDKLRIVDRGSTVSADIILDKTRLMGQITVTRQGPDTVKKDLALSTIDNGADYTIVPSLAQIPRDPVAVTTSVGKDSAYLPAIMDAFTRTAIVTFTKYHEEAARKTISGTAMAYGLEIEPGTLLGIADLGDNFNNEVFKVAETTHGVNNVVEFVAVAIMDCDIGSDPHISRVVLLMGFEGSNGATGAPGMVDESPAAHGLATVSGATISTSHFKYGSSSLSLNGSSGITFPDSVDWYFGSGRFTVEMFIYPNSLTGTQFLCGQWALLNSWVLWLNGGVLSWNTSTTGSDNNADAFGGTVVSSQQHVCIDYDGLKYRLYLQGSMVGSFSTPRTLFNAPTPLHIGDHIGSLLAFNGFIDELRITKGVARYASDSGFTVPTAAFPRA